MKVNCWSILVCLAAFNIVIATFNVDQTPLSFLFVLRITTSCYCFGACIVIGFGRMHDE